MRLRAAVGTLVVSGTVLAALVTSEGWAPIAKPPVKGDVPTVGFGFTKGVKANDTIDPVRAVIRLNQEADQFAQGIKSCIKVDLYQHEFDAYLQLAYNIGVHAFCSSTLVRYLNQQDYMEACRQILRWDKFKGRVLRGLTIRRQKEYQVCLGSRAS